MSSPQTVTIPQNLNVSKFGNVTTNQGNSSSGGPIPGQQSPSLGTGIFNRLNSLFNINGPWLWILIGVIILIVIIIRRRK